MDKSARMPAPAGKPDRLSAYPVEGRWIRLSIKVRKKQAEHQAAKRTREYAGRHPRPVMPALGLPEDVSAGLARIILLGDGRALVENLTGVADVGERAIRLAVRGGIVSIEGKGLYLTDVREGALAVEGRIERVELPRADREEAENRD